MERGSYDELTLAANRQDLNALRLRQRVLIDVSQVSLATTMLGEPVSMPIALAPTGLIGLVHVAMTLTGTRDVRTVKSDVIASQ